MKIIPVLLLLFVPLFLSISIDRKGVIILCFLLLAVLVGRLIAYIKT